MKEANGINSLNLDRTIDSIYDSSDRVKRILDDISNLVDESTNYVNCPEFAKYYDKFSSVRSNIPTITKNISSYATDLINVKKNYSNRVDEIVEIFK